MVSLSQIQDVPPKNMLLVVGAPGSGKSTFCHQSVLNNLATNRPVIFVTTEHAPADVSRFLQERGLGEVPSAMLTFVDAFHETVGLSSAARPDTVHSSCGNLTSIEVAILKLQDKLRKTNILLVFDSLTSPYLLNGPEIIKFLRLSLAKFTAEGNAVLACMDEGCGKAEDIGAMMSIANGIIKMDVEDELRVLNVVKHPVVEPTIIRSPKTTGTALPLQTLDAFIEKYYKAVSSGFQASFRSEVGDFVNVFWRSFTFWGGMLWDPKRFPRMLYDLTKAVTYQGATLYMTKLPWYHRIMQKFLPKGAFRSPKFIEKRLFPIMAKPNKEAGGGIMEYLVEDSTTDEHYIRIHEGASCWGLDNVGVHVCYEDAANLAGFMQFFDRWGGREREWNAVETICTGMGAPYCDFKVAPRELDELDASLTAMDCARLEVITDRLMDHVTGFIVDHKPLGERPTLGRGVHAHEFIGLLTLPALASERFRMAVRMAGAMAGKRLGEQLMTFELREAEAIRRMIDLLEYCKVGKVAMDETFRIRENCESFGIEGKQPTCFFTTGFLNGVFSAVTNQHVKETKCIGMGDPYCEWEFK